MNYSDIIGFMKYVKIIVIYDFFFLNGYEYSLDMINNNIYQLTSWFYPITIRWTSEMLIKTQRGV